MLSILCYNVSQCKTVTQEMGCYKFSCCKTVTPKGHFHIFFITILKELWKSNIYDVLIQTRIALKVGLLQFYSFTVLQFFTPLGYYYESRSLKSFFNYIKVIFRFP